MPGRFSVRITSSYLPIQPWNVSEDTLLSAAFEAQSFDDRAAEPNTSLFNLLYVYPISLKYDGQKAFSKARNIVCTIRFVAAAGSEHSKVLCFSLSCTFRINFCML